MTEGSIFTIRGGRLRRVAVPATAGNAVYSLQANTNPAIAELRVHLISARITLVADATVASRVIQIRRLNSLATGTSSTLGPAIQSSAITASNSGTLSLSSLQFITNASTDCNAGGINPDFFSIERTGITGDPTDMCFHISISNGVVGDSFSGTLEILELPC